jgi:hypothetical protein
MITKQASTELPLSPEEEQEASRLLGRSLFSALQLAREQEQLKRTGSMNNMMEDERVLRIPIPANLLPAHQKTAAQEVEDYAVNPGISKYTGGFLGAAYGGGIGSAVSNKALGLGNQIKQIGKGGLLGGMLGLGAGALLDEKIQQKLRSLNFNRRLQAQQSEQSVNPEILRRFLEEQQMMRMQAEMGMPPEKMGSYDPTGSPGIFARAFRTGNQPLQMLAGGREGFADAKKEYYMQEKARIQKELMDVQKEYINVLSRIKTGSEKNEETPNVDAFCNGIAHATLFGKTAEDNDPDIEEGSVKRLLSEALQVAKKPFQPAIDTAATGLLGTAAGSAYITYLLRKKMREEPDNYMQENLPTRVELQPYV